MQKPLGSGFPGYRSKTVNAEANTKSESFAFSGKGVKLFARDAVALA